jgi:predicted CDP-diglyceride synthetase/phosphatidate cytidylyltransferase
MRLLLLPLHGAFFVIFLAVAVTKLVALIDAAVRPERAYVAAGKQTKTFWVVILVLALVLTFGSFLSLLGLVAAIVYLVDVRPAVRQA